MINTKSTYVTNVSLLVLFKCHVTCTYNKGCCVVWKENKRKFTVQLLEGPFPPLSQQAIVSRLVRMECQNNYCLSAIFGLAIRSIPICLYVHALATWHISCIAIMKRRTPEKLSSITIIVGIHYWHHNYMYHNSAGK